MIMDGLETMSFGDVSGVQFQHLLNFETFKAELGGGSAGEDSPLPISSSTAGSNRLIRSTGTDNNTSNVNDSLNTPLASFMDLPIFFGPSVILPPPSGTFDVRLMGTAAVHLFIKYAGSPSRARVCLCVP